MWQRGRRTWRYGSVFAAPFGFYVQTGFGFPRRSEYLRRLEDYRQELQDELREVE